MARLEFRVRANNQQIRGKGDIRVNVGTYPYLLTNLVRCVFNPYANE